MDKVAIRTTVTRTITHPVVAYVVLGIAAVAGYAYSVSLLAVQTPWINVVMGKATANIVLALLLWVALVERVGKKRKWSSRKMWSLQLSGVLILAVIVHYTPV